MIEKLYKYDKKRFKKGLIIDINNASLEQLESKIMFDVHAIEKGLSHNDFRPKFGVTALKSLSKALKIYNNKGFDKTRERYLVSLSVIKSYIEKHKKLAISTDFLFDVFDSEVFEAIKYVNLDLSGTYTIKNKDTINYETIDFRTLALNRMSVREYSDDAVDIHKIEEAIKISIKTPSVCNRQPSRVYLLTNPEQIKKTLEIQGGYKGYKTPPVLILVTSSNNVFLSPTERNEGFIDGGLFSMSLLYSFEYMGLGACALNAMMDGRSENRIKEYINIPEEENLIMFISVGNYKNEIVVPKSYRDDISSVLRVRV